MVRTRVRKSCEIVPLKMDYLFILRIKDRFGPETSRKTETVVSLNYTFFFTRNIYVAFLSEKNHTIRAYTELTTLVMVFEF
jgi:hypothetical protein